MYVPNQVKITPNAKGDARADAILERIKDLNPNVHVEDIGSEVLDIPNLLTEADVFQHYKETVVLAHRKDAFFEVFASPGDIVEEMNTMCKVLQFCSSRCEFCYLHQAGGANVARYQKLWTNVDDIERHYRKELLVHRTALTLWSAKSFYQQKTFAKIPDDLHKQINDEVRPKFTQKLNPIPNDEGARIFLESFIKGDPSNARLAYVKRNIRNFYDENSKKKMWVNIGEYSDIVAIDHIAGYMTWWMELLNRIKDARLVAYTKSANLDAVLNAPADHRLKIVMNFNSEHVINKYEQGTATLNERIDVTKKLLAKNDVLMDFTIEPFLKYDGFEKDYRELAERIVSEFDLTNPNIQFIKFGGVRYKPELKEVIQASFPKTDLFDDYQGLVAPTYSDRRMRYPIDLRVSMSQMFMEVFDNVKSKLILGCEHQSVWEKVGLDWVGHLDRFVFQYNEKNKNVYS